MKSTKELRKEARQLEPVVRIGKEGVKESSVNEILKALKNRKLIKIKILKSVKAEKERIFDEILKRTGAKPVERVGSVIVICRADDKG